MELNNEISDISEIRLKINNYFRDVINTIDCETEELILELNAFPEEDLAEKNKIIIEELNASRNSKIEIINGIEQYIINLLNIREINLKKDDINSSVHSIFRKFCFYLDAKILKNFLNGNKRDGLLVVTDYFLSNEDVNKLKYHNKSFCW